MASPEFGDRDVFGVKVGPSGAVVQVFQVRSGRVVERIEFIAEAGTDTGKVSTVVEAALQQFYTEQAPPPDVHVPELPEEAEAIESWLSGLAGRKVRVSVPQRGDKRGLLDLVHRNAEVAYRSRFDSEGTAQYEALELIQAALRLPDLPRRIECFDISTIQGSETVASMVVCEDGRMKRGEYRKFRVREGNARTGAPSLLGDGQPEGLTGPNVSNSGRFLDDFAAMEQVVRRRYARVLEAGGPFPDLIVIDGGKGQLNAAYAALESVGLSNLVAVGLAKKEELVFTRDSDQPLALAPHGTALRLLQRIRDEAHRFAVTFHRKARTMRDLRSELDDVPGVGPRRRKTLLTTFGSVAGVRRATREELTAVVGAKAADAIVAHFARSA
jgi:excinuclease ABC subunit C